MAFIWSTPIQSGRLPDTDDYMRMVRVFALLDGEDGPSYAAPRLGPDGSEIGWSRLIDWPLAAVQGALETVTGRMDAAMTATTVMPALALLAFLSASFAYAGHLTTGAGTLRGLFTILAVLCLWGLLRQFMPGRVDHHMWQATLGVAAFAALVRIHGSPKQALFPLLAGFFLATGLAVGADALPWMTFGAALTGFFWLACGAAYEKAGLRFGLALSGTALAYHILLHDPGYFFAPLCDSLALPWLSLTGAVLLFWSAIAMLPTSCKSSSVRRLACGVAVAAPVLIALAVFFPSCFSDPHMITDPLVRTIWLDSVLEARSLPGFWTYSKSASLFFMVPPVMGLAAALWAARVETQRRIAWLGLAAVLLCGLGLAFYQVRTVDFAQAVAVAPLSWLFMTLAEKARAVPDKFSLTRRQRMRLAAAVFLIGLVCLGTAAQDKTKTQPARTLPALCSVRKAASALNALPGSLMIAAPIDAGSEILFRTPHKVLSAPYHRNQRGILAAHRIFAAESADAAYAAATDSGADILMICAAQPPLPFAATLLSGTVPEWLEPVGGGKIGGYLLYKKVR